MLSFLVFPERLSRRHPALTDRALKYILLCFDLYGTSTIGNYSRSDTSSSALQEGIQKRRVDEVLKEAGVGMGEGRQCGKNMIVFSDYISIFEGDWLMLNGTKWSLSTLPPLQA